MKYSKTLHKLAARDRRIEEYEFSADDGHFIITANGWCWDDDCVHTWAEDTVKDILDRLGYIKPCSGKQGCCRGELDR